MELDWRLNGQESYLFKVNLLKVRFRQFEDADHAHCDFCWAKFSENKDDLHEGYATVDGYHIICEKCFDDFKDQFQWTVISQSGDVNQGTVL